MESIVMMICFLFCAVCTGVLTYQQVHRNDKAPFSDEEVDQIKQVLNMLTWGGEYENKD